MAIRNARPLTFRPAGLTDSVDGTNSFPGSMTALQNLVPAPHTQSVFVLRPAAQEIAGFAGFTTPAQGEALLVVGSRIYGFIQSGRFAGHSEPFCWDTKTNSFVTISGVTSGNTPLSTANTGDWTPPTAVQAGSRVLLTHPGFSLPNAFGWLDMTGFSDSSHTGSTHASTTIDTLSANVLTAGWRPGMTISDSAADIPAGTRIVSIASNGLSAIISNAATASSVGTTFSVAGGSVAAPLWAAGNVNQNPLVAVPATVALFSGRAYYAVNNAVAFSDAGDPLQASNASGVQVLTFQNGINVTALAGLPLNNQLGGIIQSLMCFQGDTIVQQITGDPSTTNLAVNTLNEAVGTLAPNSIAATPLGLMFIAPDGLRLIDFTARVSDPIGAYGRGVSLPFINAVNPGRICAAYNDDVYRVSVTSDVRLEYWYHLSLKVWTGPHTFPGDLIEASQTGVGFVMFPSGVVGLFQSQPAPSPDSNYVENGVALQFVYETALLPDTEQMAENAMIETSIAIGINPNFTAVISFSNEAGQTLGSITLPGDGTPGALWGAMIWGLSSWGGGSSIFQQRRLPWDKPLVFKQGRVTVIGGSGGTVSIGNLYMRYQILGYFMQGLVNAV